MASRWRPKNRRQILQLDDEGSQSPSVLTPNSQVAPSISTTATTNKLHALLGHYNSDDDESGKEEDDSEFKDFMNEIKSAEEVPSAPSEWQELWDPQSGQPYYWHTVTNELTWDKPQDFAKKPPTTAPVKSSTVAVKASKKSTAEDNKKGSLIAAASSEQDPAPSTKVFGPLPAQEGPIHSDILKGDRKDDAKISFKIVPVTEKSLKSGPSDSSHATSKTNGGVIDVDSIIAAIEKEIPPDHVKTETFVPLFKRRQSPSQESRPKLGNNFKKFFPPNHQPAVDLESATASPPTIVNTFRGLGYQEKEETTAAADPGVQKVVFIAGEILKPMVPVVPVVPLTLAQKITRLENQLNSQELPSATTMSKVQLTAQLDILKDAWSRKKLDADYFDEWLETIEKSFNEETKRPETSQDQVIDMILDDSASDGPNTPPLTESSSGAVKSEEKVECLDSALNSFYTDLASMDSATAATDSPSVPTAETVPATADTVPPPVVVEEETSLEPVKGIKRMKMSSDMTSLVAKWQKIHQANS